MCGRFARINTAKEIKQIFNIDQIEIELKPSYNIAPTHEVAVIVENRQSKLTAMRWGLIPSWAKDDTIGSRLINARSDTIDKKSSFSNSFINRRCLIVASGFYEWQKQGKDKLPFYIHLNDNKPFCFAGIYDHWTSPDGKKITSCSIITTDAIDTIKEIHLRMPLIISGKDFSLWLTSNNIAELQHLLMPYSGDDIEFYEVSEDVNSLGNDNAGLIEPLHNLFS